MTPLFHIDPRSAADPGDELSKPTPSGHAVDCDWHCDQYPWECTCGLTTPKAARP